MALDKINDELSQKEDKDEEAYEVDWSKMSKAAMNSGYKEGINAARVSAMQDCFDSGYEEGLKFGMAAGFYQGIHSCVAHLDPFSQEEKDAAVEMAGKMSVLHDPDMINCQMCSDGELLNGSLSEAKEAQVSSNESLKKELEEKCGQRMNKVKIKYDGYINNKQL